MKRLEMKIYNIYKKREVFILDKNMILRYLLIIALLLIMALLSYFEHYGTMFLVNIILVVYVVFFSSKISFPKKQEKRR